jgi:hypothetical protein
MDRKSSRLCCKSPAAELLDGLVADAKAFSGGESFAGDV